MKIDGFIGEDYGFGNQRIERAYVRYVLEKVEETARQKGEKIRILDLATGANYLNADIARSLCDKGIDFEFILSDIAPDWMKHGVEHIKEKLSEEEQRRVKCVLLDVRDVTKIVTEARYDDKAKGTEPLEQVLERSEYDFLRTGYDGTKRIVSLERESFDFIIGRLPYCSSSWEYQIPGMVDTILELLPKNGYHIVVERQTARLDAKRERTNEDIVYATRNHVAVLEATLNAKAKARGRLSGYSRWRVSDDSYGYMKNGDIILDKLLAYQKVK